VNRVDYSDRSATYHVATEEHNVWYPASSVKKIAPAPKEEEPRTIAYKMCRVDPETGEYLSVFAGDTQSGCNTGAIYHYHVGRTYDDHTDYGLTCYTDFGYAKLCASEKLNMWRREEEAVVLKVEGWGRIHDVSTNIIKFKHLKVWKLCLKPSPRKSGRTSPLI